MPKLIVLGFVENAALMEILPKIPTRALVEQTFVDGRSVEVTPTQQPYDYSSLFPRLHVLTHCQRVCVFTEVVVVLSAVRHRRDRAGRACRAEVGGGARAGGA